MCVLYIVYVYNINCKLQSVILGSFEQFCFKYTRNKIVAREIFNFSLLVYMKP